jgi:prephenate dehydratase
LEGIINLEKKCNYEIRQRHLQKGTGLCKIEHPHRTRAAIGGSAAAQIYDMDILAEGIETNPRNFPRFVVVGNSSPMEGGVAKSSIVLSTVNQPGALAEV